MAKPINKEEGQWYIWRREYVGPQPNDFTVFEKKVMKPARRKHNKKIIKEEIENGKAE